MQLLVNRHGSDQNIATELGTTRQNIQFQRKALDIKPHNASITKRNMDILKLRKANWLMRELSERFKLSERQIRRIVNVGNNGND